MKEQFCDNQRRERGSSEGKNKALIYEIYNAEADVSVVEDT